MAISREGGDLHNYLYGWSLTRWLGVVKLVRRTILPILVPRPCDKVSSAHSDLPPIQLMQFDPFDD